MSLFKHARRNFFRYKIRAPSANCSRYNLVLYFDSPIVEVWTEYRLESAMDFMTGFGGTLGLIMGMSLLSVLQMVLDLLTSAAR